MLPELLDKSTGTFCTVEEDNGKIRIWNMKEIIRLRQMPSISEERNFNREQGRISHGACNQPAAALCVVCDWVRHSPADSTDVCPDPPWNNQVAAIIAEVLEAVRPILVHGIPNLGIPPLDPLGPLGHITFHVDTSALRLDGSVNDTQVMKLSQYIICQVNLTIGITQKFGIDLRLEDLHIQGFYSVDGIAFSLFPVFGHGSYEMDVYNAGVTGGAKMVYNPITDHASIKNLKLDVMFEDLQLVMECILGCGDMSDLVNSLVSDIAPPMFFAIWDTVNPILTKGLEDGINDILKNISISDIITLEQIRAMELGNANEYMDLVMLVVDGAIVDQGLDPAPLPHTTLSFGVGEAELYDGHLTGLSTLRRSGTSTLDKVADWVFLYANVAINDLRVQYMANVTTDTNTVLDVLVDTSVERVAVYMVARTNVYNFSVDLDQFVITEFGKIDVMIDGLGLLDYIVGPLTEAVANMVHEDVANILETTIKDIIQKALNETPWPSE